MPEPRTPNAERSFAERLTAAIQDKKSCVVVGLDPVLERLPPETFSVIGASASGGEGLTARASVAIGLFLDQVISVVSDLAVAVKPNAAFFERYGAAGWDCLRQVCASAHKAGLLVILDAKRGTSATPPRRTPMVCSGIIPTRPVRTSTR